jgi:hypothetical protein
MIAVNLLGRVTPYDTSHPRSAILVIADIALHQVVVGPSAQILQPRRCERYPIAVGPPAARVAVHISSTSKSTITG